MVAYKDLFLKLAEKNVQYVVAGGFAVNFHQVQRATVDLDLVVHLEASNVHSFIEAMKELGYEPRVPVDPQDLGKPERRKEWIDNKGMTVFRFYHSENTFETVDVFIEEPIAFETLFSKRMDVTAFNIQIPVMSGDHLIQLKEQAGRDKDRFDIEQLKKIDSLNSPTPEKGKNESS